MQKQCPNNFKTTPQQLVKSRENDYFNPQNNQNTDVNIGTKGAFVVISIYEF